MVSSREASLWKRGLAAWFCPARNWSSGGGLWVASRRRCPEHGLVGPIWPEIPAQKCLHSRPIQPDPTKSNHEGNAEGRIPGLPKSTSQLAPSLTINNQLPDHPPSSGPIRPDPTKSNLIQPVKGKLKTEGGTEHANPQEHKGAPLPNPLPAPSSRGEGIRGPRERCPWPQANRRVGRRSSPFCIPHSALCISKGGSLNPQIDRAVAPDPAESDRIRAELAGTNRLCPKVIQSNPTKSDQSNTGQVTRTAIAKVAGKTGSEPPLLQDDPT